MKKWKRFFQEKIVVSAVMCVLLAVVLTTATTAWYAVNRTDSMYGLRLKTGGTGKIKVAVEPDGPDIMERTPDSQWNDEKNVPVLSINLKDFENIEGGKIAPGAYGPMNFYITSLEESITAYQLKVEIEYRPVGSSDTVSLNTDSWDTESLDTVSSNTKSPDTVSSNTESPDTDFSNTKSSITEEQKEKIEAMICNHIFLYKEKYDGTDGEGKPVVLFREPLPFQKNVAEVSGDLTFEVEEPVTLYWVWNYELTDIPDYQNTDFYKKNAGDTGDVRQAVRAYDEEDTVLGNYINDIRFNVYIEGTTKGAGSE